MASDKAPWLDYMGNKKKPKEQNCPFASHRSREALLKKIKVYVDDNFHHMDETERQLYGEFDTIESALQVCREIVDTELQKGLKTGVTAEELFNGYCAGGLDPWVENSDFSAWDYARKRCAELCNPS